MSYQWRFNSSPLTGATASLYTRTNIQPADVGLYSVLVSNFAGSAASSNAALTLLVPAPTLVIDSPQVIVWQGLSNLLYTVEARTNFEAGGWTSIGTASSPGHTISFTNQAEASQGFYRVRYP